MGSRPVFSTANVQFDFALLGSNAPFSAEKKILAMTRLQVGCGDRKGWRCKKLVLCVEGQFKGSSIR